MRKMLVSIFSAATVYSVTRFQVHENRDKIMLENEDKDGSDDELRNEVFALNKLKEFSEEEAEGIEEEEDASLVSRPKKGKKDKRNLKIPGKTALSDATAPPETSDSDEPLESWGRNKSAYYSTNAADIDSDDEEARILEENEVIKLQKQARATLEEDDFGTHDGQRQMETLDR
jgi:U3 small nucleolar RNA-associated protein 3